MAQFDPTNKRLLQDKSFAYLVSFPELLVAPTTPVTSPSLLGKRRKKMSDNKRKFTGCDSEITTALHRTKDFRQGENTNISNQFNPLTVC